MTKDVVCGAMVSEQRSSERGLMDQFAGTTYYFCSKPCRKKFHQNPHQYVGAPPPTGKVSK